MPDISKIKIIDTVYEVKDEEVRLGIEKLLGRVITSDESKSTSDQSDNTN